MRLRLCLRLRLRLLLLRLLLRLLLLLTRRLFPAALRIAWVLACLTTHVRMRILSLSSWTCRMAGILRRLSGEILVLLSGTWMVRIAGIVAWVVARVVARVVAGITRVVARVMARIARVVTGIARTMSFPLIGVVTRVMAGIAWIVGRVARVVMSGVLGLVSRIVGRMTRILVMVGRSGRRSRRTRCSDTLRRGCSRNRGLPRGSRQRGRIPWLDGLLHDGTHDLAQPTSQPADFYLRLEGHYFFFLPRRWALIYLLLPCQISSFLIKL